MIIKCTGCGAINHYEAGKARDCEFCDTPLDIPSDMPRQEAAETKVPSENVWRQTEVDRRSAAPIETKWYQKSGWIIALLIFFFPIGLFLMWKHAKWNKITKMVITAFFLFAIIRNYV